jgi:hypothetical protein
VFLIGGEKEPEAPRLKARFERRVVGLVGREVEPREQFAEQGVGLLERVADGVVPCCSAHGGVSGDFLGGTLQVPGAPPLVTPPCNCRASYCAPQRELHPPSGVAQIDSGGPRSKPPLE